MHLTSMPARGTEIISIRYRNTANGGLRNLVYGREIALSWSGFPSKVEEFRAIIRS